MDIDRLTIPNVFETYRAPITVSTSGILRAHIDGRDIDPIELTQYLLAQELGESAVLRNYELETAARTAGRLSTLFWDSEYGTFPRRTLAKTELHVGKAAILLGDSYQRAAIQSGIPQHVADSVAQSMNKFPVH